jgi:hypothetical protein
MTVSHTYKKVSSGIEEKHKHFIDVEHAATTPGGITHRTGAPPPMRYEGFESSPYGHESAQENEIGIVRAHSSAAIPT